MTAEQAIQILDNLTAQIALKREDHKAVDEALSVLKSLAAKPKLSEVK